MQAEDLIGEINRKSGSETRAHIGYGAFAAYFNRGEDLDNTVNVERRGAVSIRAQPRPAPTPQACAHAHTHVHMVTQPCTHARARANALVHVHVLVHTFTCEHAYIHTRARR